MEPGRPGGETAGQDGLPCQAVSSKRAGRSCPSRQRRDPRHPTLVARRGPQENWGVDGDKARRILNLTDGSENPAGEWNRMVVECLGDEVKVWVNGDLVNHGSGCTATKGQIALQAEGSEVEFRTLVLTPITELSDEAP